MPYKDGPYIRLEVPNEDTGEIEEKYVSVVKLFSQIWDDYIREHIPNDYTREMLRELGLTPCEVFHMMERLQGGKAEFARSDYREMSYI